MAMGKTRNSAANVSENVSVGFPRYPPTPGRFHSRSQRRTISGGRESIAAAG